MGGYEPTVVDLYVVGSSKRMKPDFFFYYLKNKKHCFCTNQLLWYKVWLSVLENVQKVPAIKDDYKNLRNYEKYLAYI